MGLSPMTVQVGKCYLVEPGSRIYRVVAVTADGNVQYTTQSQTDSRGSVSSLVTVSRDRFVRDAVREVPCPV